MTGLTVHIPTLETERLTLRPHRLDDFEVFAKFILSTRSGFRAPTRDKAWSSFTADISSWCLNGFGYWAIDLKDGTHIGQTGLCQHHDFPEPELGWSLYDGFEGRGYATEGAQSVLRWARSKVSSLVSYINPTNTRSIAVAERLGAGLDPSAARPGAHAPADCLVFRHWGPA